MNNRSLFIALFFMLCNRMVCMDQSMICTGKNSNKKWNREKESLLKPKMIQCKRKRDENNKNIDPINILAGGSKLFLLYQTLTMQYPRAAILCSSCIMNGICDANKVLFSNKIDYVKHKHSFNHLYTQSYCTICQKNFSNPYNLNAHCRLKHLIY